MNIKLEAPRHPNQEDLYAFCEDILLKKFGKYGFLNTVEIRFVTEDDHVKVSLMFKPEKGGTNYVSGEDKNEHKAFNEAISKMRVLIEKYKQKHYKSMGKKA